MSLCFIVTACRTSPAQYTNFPDNPDRIQPTVIADTPGSRERYFFVDGNVNKRGPVTYVGQTDIVKAIEAAGGFTPYVNIKKVRIRLIHPNGQSETIEFDRVSRESGKYPVYPGDKIFVPYDGPW